ncbi:MAG: redoxin domain-containing protein [Roseiflexaceae bacterium]|jgi:cytochrome c biogenesis protein CcmG/thiol:disulfide interchange protein DsbE
MATAQTYYEQLGVAVDATTSEIVAACEHATMRYRADLQTDPSGELANAAMQRIAAIEEIRDTLLDPRQRYLYDRSLGLLIQPPPHSDTPPVAPAEENPVRRELMMVILGGLIGIVIVAIVWVASARLAAPVMPAAAETNRPATDFTLPLLGGDTLTLSAYRGKIVVLNFWGTWCEPCKAETPALEAAYQQLKSQNVEFIGINLRHQEAPGIQGDIDVANFVDEYGVSYPVVFDTKGEISQKYQISPIPVSYFIDAQGNVRYVYVGTLTTQDTLELVRRLQDG